MWMSHEQGYKSWRLPPPLYVITIERRRWKTGICFVHRRTLCSPLSGYLTDLLSRAYWGAIGRFYVPRVILRPSFPKVV